MEHKRKVYILVFTSVYMINKLRDDKDYWCLMDCESETPHYFNSESEARIYAIKNNIKNFIVGLENG